MYIRVSVAGSACWAFGSFHFGWNGPAVLAKSLNDVFPIKVACYSAVKSEEIQSLEIYSPFAPKLKGTQFQQRI
jgi:hypothetical protein